ncbi:MAG: hypothetical protein LBS00_01570 [Synergistaceae bacterium]|jgi:hypothetical protein|nr:hypothetical protein [Synergistaceae bacterium]
MAKKNQGHQNPTRFDSLEDIGLYNEDTKASLMHYFNGILEGEVVPESKKHLTESEVKELLNRCLDEIDARSCLILLTFIESQFRLHYQGRSKTQRKIRAELKKKHGSANREKITHPSLEDDLFGAWKKILPGEAFFFGNLKTFFKYRHWMAHGRYFILASNKPDHDGLFLIAQKVVELCKI